MKIIVKDGTPENMEKALREAFNLVGAQLNEIADKYKVMVSATAYPDKGDQFGQNMYLSVSDKNLLASGFIYFTGEYAKEEQSTDLQKTKKE